MSSGLGQLCSDKEALKPTKDKWKNVSSGNLHNLFQEWTVAPL